MPLPMPLEPPTTRTFLPLKSSSFIARDPLSLRLTSLGIGASLVNPGAHDIIFSKHSMSGFKQLSRSVAGGFVPDRRDHSGGRRSDGAQRLRACMYRDALTSHHHGVVFHE